MSRKYLFVVVGASASIMCGVAIAAFNATAGASPGPAAGEERVRPVTYAAVVRARTGRLSPEAALGEAMERMRGGVVASASITAPPAAIRQLDPKRAALPWLRATVRVPVMRDGLDIKPLWEADLLQGAVVERAGTAENVRDDFGGATFDVVLPNATEIVDASSGLGDVARGQQYSTASDAEVEASIADVLVEAGLTPISINVMRPLGPAPAVVASARDLETATAAIVPLTKRLFGDPPIYEGYYLEVRDEAGKAVVRVSTAFRTGAGRFWVDPRWADHVGIKTLGRP